MTEGQAVTLKSSPSNVERIVVRDLGEVVLVCRHEEYKQAKDEGREPIAVGVRKPDILS